MCVPTAPRHTYHDANPLHSMRSTACAAQHALHSMRSTACAAQKRMPAPLHGRTPADPIALGIPTVIKGHRPRKKTTCAHHTWQMRKLRNICPMFRSPTSAAQVQAGNTVFVIDPEYEVPDFALPRCADLRELVDKVCQMPDRHNFRSDERGRDRFRTVVMSAGEGKPETVVSLQKPVSGVCEPEELEFRFDETGKGRPLTQLDERLETAWAEYLDVPLVVEAGPGSDGTFYAGKEDDGFSVRLQLHLHDYNNIWSFTQNPPDESDGEEDKGPPFTRPRGRTPSGKTWDRQSGCWIDEESDRAKGKKRVEKKARNQQDIEESSDAFVATLLSVLTTVETRIVTLVYACADRRTDVFISRDQLLQGLTALRVSRPTERLEQARIRLLSTLKHNGYTGTNAGLALTPEGVQMAIGAIDFELGSIDRAVGVLKSACETGELSASVDAQGGSVKKRRRDASNDQHGQHETSGPHTPPANASSTAPRSGGGSAPHAGEVEPTLAPAVEAAAEGVLGSVTELETSLNKMLMSFPQQVEAGDLQYEIGQEGHQFFMENNRFPTPDETQELVRTVQREYLSNYQIGNVTRSKVESVIALLSTARNGATAAHALAKNYDARAVD